MKVVAFNGSPRKEGNTYRLLRAALDVLEEKGVETELIQLGGERLAGCRACFICAKNQDRRCSVTDDKVNECIEKMLAADGVLLGSPTYFANVSAEMKALIDRAGMVAKVNGDMLKRKAGAGVVAVRRGGALTTFDALNHFFLIGQMIVPGSDYWNMGVGMAEGDVDKDEEGIGTMRALGENMAWLLERTR